MIFMSVLWNNFVNGMMEDFYIEERVPAQLIDQHLNDFSENGDREPLLKLLRLMQKQCFGADYDELILKLDTSRISDQPSLIFNGLLILCDKLYRAKKYILCSQILTVAEKLLRDLTLFQDNCDGYSLTFVNSSSLVSDKKYDILPRLSFCYIHVAKYNEAVDLTKECLNESRDTLPRIIHIHCVNVLAKAFRHLKDFPKAIKYNQQLLETCKSLNENEMEKLGWNNKSECDILWNLSACYKLIGDLESALIYAEKYLQVVRFSSQDNLIKIYSYLGSLQYSTRNFDSALSSHNTELALCKKYNDKKGIAHAYGNLGLVYSAMGKTNFANELFIRESQIARLLENSDLVIDSLQKFGAAKMQEGETTLAISYFKKLYDIAKETHNWKMQCIAYLNLGKLNQQQGTLNFARHYLEQGMHRSRDLEMKKESIEAEMHLAQVLKTLGYYEDARKHFKNVVLYFENVLDTQNHFDILPNNDIARKLEKSWKDLQEVLVKLDCWQDAFEIAELCHSRIYCNMARKKQATSAGNPVTNVPRTSSEINKLLNTLPSSTTILCFTVTKAGFFLWMLKPGKGVTKFAKQNALPSHPIEQLVRDCMRSLGLSKKGDKCCYETEHKRKVASNCLSQQNFKNSKNGTLTVHEMPNSRRNVDKSQQSLKKKGMGQICTAPANECSSMEKVEVMIKPNVCSITSEDCNCNKNNCGATEQTYDSGYQGDSLNIKCKDSKEKDNVTCPFDAKYSLHNKTCDSLFTESSDFKSSCSSTFTESIPEEHSQKKMLKELFKLLLGQVEHLLASSNKGDSLIIIPDGILNMVPFHLLIDKNGMALHQGFKVSVLPCLALLSVKKTQGFHGTCLVYGNPCLQDACMRNINGDVLSYETESVEKELRLVSSVLGAGYFSGKLASKAEFIKLLSNNDVIHVATLGCVSKGWLLFSPNQHREDSVAEMSSYIFDIGDLAQLQLNAKLVVLSSCDQCPHGVGDCDVFEFHLATGLLAAGAESVVMFLYAIPHKVLRIIIHQLYRLLEEGHSISESLQFIYNSMSCSEDFSHPGYWGGIVHLGQDTTIDIVNIRKKTLEKAIDEEISLVRQTKPGSSVSGANSDGDRFFIDTESFQINIASLIASNNGSALLEALKDLLQTTIDEIDRFICQSSLKSDKNLPAVSINQDLMKSTELKELLHQLGFKVQPTLFENDVTFLLLPTWNFDKYLDNVLVSVTSVHAINSMSKSAGFCLSQVLPRLTETSLGTLKYMINSGLTSPETKMKINDSKLKFLWAATAQKRFLQQIGFYAVGTSLFLHIGNSYDSLQNSTNDLVTALLSMYKKDQSLVRNAISRFQGDSFSPWLTRPRTDEERSSRQLLASSLHTANNKFYTLQKRGRRWHDATVESWISPAYNRKHIGPPIEKTEKCERFSHGVLKIKVKPGGTPSSSRFPIVEKPKVTKYHCHKLREELEEVFIERNDKLSSRKRYEVCKIYSR